MGVPEIEAFLSHLAQNENVARWMSKSFLVSTSARHYNHYQNQNKWIGSMKPLSREAILRILKKEMPYLRDHFGVNRVALFGSFARGEANEASDIDIVVSLSKPLGFAFIQLADYLEEKLGRKVDLVTALTLETGIADPRRAHIARSIQESLIYV